ncbi:MAG: YdeI/OmpD-associated family protein [Chitinophagaceae bacterium]|nr:YdeI/OmpD-associated family protein [Chitinophagaceae bacterium]
MELRNGVKTFYAKSAKHWRAWLAKNHQVEASVWLIIYKKESGVATVYYPEAVDEALCFGWIDSKPNKRDDTSYFQFFSKRKPKSNWSKVNKQKVERLLAEGRMAPAGLEMVELAKRTGTWNALNEVEDTVMPPDLKAAFAKDKVASANWNKFPRSSRRGILEWILNAKRPETRNKRIEETVRLAAENIRANYPGG